MIPFGVKILWFVLSLTGLLCSWVVLIPFGRAVGAMWGPGLYGVGNTLLQVVFCLGMIWRMDPFQMPRAFCITQTLLIGLATFLLTGVAGAISLATSFAVLRPKAWGDTSALGWRKIFYIPVVIFPMLGTIAHIVVVLKFDTVKPTDDLHCDSSDPEWGRFLGYAGTPYLISIPCMYLSVRSLIRIYQTNKTMKLARQSLVIEEQYATIPPRSSTKMPPSVLGNDASSQNNYRSPISSTGMTTSTSSPSFATADEYPFNMSAAGSAPFRYAPPSHSPVQRKFHLPFKPPSTTAMDIDTASPHSQVDTVAEDDETTSEVSSSPPVFAKPDMQPMQMEPRYTPSSGARGGIWRGTAGMGDGSNGSKTQWVQLNRLDHEGEADEPHSTVLMLPGEGKNGDGSDIVSGNGAGGRMSTTLSNPNFDLTKFRGRRTTPNLTPAMWRIILFQTAFCAVQVLTCISTIYDLATHRPTPTPLGTQHFALLLAAWGPVIVFGHSPAVRSSLNFWRST